MDNHANDTSYAVLNLGNTRSMAAWVRAGGLLGEGREVATAQLTARALTDSPLASYLRKPCLIACVLPDLQAKIAAAFPAVRFLSAAMVRTDLVDFSQVDAASVGADRVANAVAAMHWFEPPVLVVDCGTAVTLEVVDRNRCFRGGAILPGRALQRGALHRHTGQLPEARLQAEPPIFPGSATEQAIQAGVDLGIAGAVLELQQWLQKLPECRDARLLVAGGDGHFFAPLLPGAELVDPLFTLRGLAVLAEPLLGQSSLGHSHPRTRNQE